MCTTYILSSNNYHKEVTAATLEAAMQQAEQESKRLNQCIDVYDRYSHYFGTASPARTDYPLYIQY